MSQPYIYVDSEALAKFFLGLSITVLVILKLCSVVLVLG